MKGRAVHVSLTILFHLALTRYVIASEFEPDLAFLLGVSDVIAEVRIVREAPVLTKGSAVCGYTYSVEFIQTFNGDGSRALDTAEVFSRERVGALESGARWLIFAASWPGGAMDADGRHHSAEILSEIEGACVPPHADLYMTTDVHSFRVLEQDPFTGTWVWTNGRSVFEDEDLVRRVRIAFDGVSVPMYSWRDIQRKFARGQ